MSSRRILAGVVLAFVAVAPALAAKNTTPPFVFAQSVLAPAPSRGWVVLLPGEGELRFGAVEAHYQQSARRLNANGFDTLIVPYEDAYDEDLDGDTDSDGERVAAVTLRAVHWMQSAHGETEDKPGAVIAWGEGAQGLWALAQIGSKYPLANLVAGVAFYPLADDQAPFNSRLPMLVQAGSEDASAQSLRRYFAAREPGGAEPEVILHAGAQHAFDVEHFVEPKVVRSMPLIGASVTFAYNAPAAREAEQRMLAFLKARLEAPE